MSLGQRIKQVRERKVYGQAELARKAGVNVNTLYRIETDQHIPRPVTIRKIALALDIDPTELVAGTLDKKAS